MKLIKFLKIRNRKTLSDFMSLINSRSFEDVEYFETRKECYKSNFKLIRNFMLFFYSAFTVSILGPLVAHEMPPSFYVPFDVELYPRAFYPWFFFLIWSCFASAVLSPNSCMFFGSMIGFLSNEFKILGMSYGETFKDLHEVKDVSDDILVEIKKRFKNNINYHVELMR